LLPSTGMRELRQLTRKRSRYEYERERPTGGWRLGSHTWWRRGPHAEGASSPGLDPVAGSGPEEEAAGSRRPPAPRLLAWLRSRRWILRRRTQLARITPPQPASHAPAALLRPPRKGVMREGGVAAPPSATRASIRPLPPAAREAAGSTDWISRAVGGSAAGISRLACWGREWGIGKREKGLDGHFFKNHVLLRKNKCAAR
jgi:hypothetical protein